MKNFLFFAIAVILVLLVFAYRSRPAAVPERPSTNGIPIYRLAEVIAQPEIIPAPAAVYGIVTKTSALVPPLFQLARFHTTCCGPGAKPDLLIVDPAEVPGFKYEQIESGTWFKVTGRALIIDNQVVFQAATLTLNEPLTDF